MVDVSQEGAVLPAPLIESIHAGNCVAFLGAGFSIPAGLPGWGELLSGMATHEKVPVEVRAHVLHLVEGGSAHSLDQAAQTLEDLLGRKTFAELLREPLQEARIEGEMQDRLRWITGIPFRAILTTNFDGILDGSPPMPRSFRRVLRPKRYRWWDPRFWDGKKSGAKVVKLHGDVAQSGGVGQGGAVITRLDYRRLLYENPSYATFLKSIMSTTTVLYLGFSFVDAYLNELRSEVLSLLGKSPGQAPIAYAVINDLPQLTRRHYFDHEGVEILHYDSHNGTDFSGFNRILESLHHATNPVFRFARLLDDKRVLWIDKSPKNNAYIHWLLSRITEVHATSRFDLTLAETAAEGLNLIEKAAAAGRPFDLVITHWGYRECDDGAERVSCAEKVLLEMRRNDLFAPVLIFSMKKDADARKKRALSLGAQAYTFTFDMLLRSMERVLMPGHQSGTSLSRSSS